MNIKRRRVLSQIFLSLFVLFVVIVLSFNKASIKEEAYNVVDRTLAQDWGIASVTGLFGVSNIDNLGDSKKEKAISLVKLFPDRILKKIPKIIKSKITGFPDRPPLERIDIDIKFKDYQSILEDRKKALEINRLYNPREVKAKIRYNGKTIKAKVRLKGDLSDHWRTATRMSLRVSLKGKKTIKGFKRFSIHKAGARQYPYEQVFQDIIEDEGLLSANHDYIRVFVNGENWGIMDIEEHMSKEFLEKEKYKESIILKFNDEGKSFYNNYAEDRYLNYLLSDEKFFVSLFQANKYMSDPIKRQHFSYVAKQFLNRNEKNILDVDSFSKAAFAAIIWNKVHALATNNTRFYFNPYTLKLEPITTDQSAFEEITSNENPIKYFYKTGSTHLFQEALSSSKGRDNFYNNLNIAVNSSRKAPEFYKYHKKFFPNNADIDFTPLLHNIDKVEKLSKPVLTKPKRKNEFVLNNKPTLKQAENFTDHVYLRHYDDGTISVFNLLDVPVKLNKLYYNGVDIEIEPRVVPPFNDPKGGFVTVNTDKTGIQDFKFTAKTSYKGYDRETKNKYTLIKDIFNPIDDNKNKLPSYIQSTKYGYKINSGKWVVNKPLVIDGNLTISAGANISFAPDSYLIIKGALNSLGILDNPVIFQPLEGSWKGLYILEAGESNLSHLNYTKIVNTSALQDGMISLTGGVTFYKSPVNIENSQITGTTAEDALNIVKSKFLIKNTFVSNTPSDAFDSDFSNGKIISSTFENIGGDAVDFSGSDVFIQNLNVIDVHDKAVSAGEGSKVDIQASYFDRVGVGIASKDGSFVNAKNINIPNYKMHAVMTYVKKDMFGASTMKITNLTTDLKNPYSRQKGTKLYVNSKLINASDLDVKQLYDSGIMKK